MINNYYYINFKQINAIIKVLAHNFMNIYKTL